jgi:hypothetical protein
MIAMCGPTFGKTKVGKLVCASFSENQFKIGLTINIPLLLIRTTIY